MARTNWLCTANLVTTQVMPKVPRICKNPYKEDAVPAILAKSSIAPAKEFAKIRPAPMVNKIIGARTAHTLFICKKYPDS